MTAPIPTDLVLYAGSLPATPFREYVAAAAGAGFDAVTLWPLLYRRAQSRDGLTTTQMRSVLEDHGLRVCDLDPCGDWLPVAPDAPTSGPMAAQWKREQFFEAAAAIGADTMVAVHLTGGTVTTDQAVEGYASLCDDAAEHGLRVALEFMPFSGIGNLAAAWPIVAGAGRSNGGLVLDVWHYVRGGRDDALLRSIPAEQIVAVQLSDGPAAAGDDLLDEAMYERMMPGAGELDVVGVLRVLGGMGVRARVGPELYQRSWPDHPAAEIAARLATATRQALAAAA
jgi:sugar phosphate isomerase/epimerase